MVFGCFGEVLVAVTVFLAVLLVVFLVGAVDFGLVGDGCFVSSSFAVMRRTLVFDSAAFF